MNSIGGYLIIAAAICILALACYAWRRKIQFILDNIHNGTVIAMIILAIIVLVVGIIVLLRQNGDRNLYNDSKDGEYASDVTDAVTSGAVGDITVRGTIIIYNGSEYTDPDAFFVSFSGDSHERDIYLTDDYADATVFHEVADYLNQNGIVFHEKIIE